MFLSALNNIAINGPDPQITGLSADSRTVQPGWLFAALPGARANGAAFIREALAKGASALLVSAETPLPEGLSVPVIRSDNPRRDISLLAARFYGAQPETVVAVTGTNGKTSTAEFTRQIWQATGRNAASLGTLGLRGAVVQGGAMTTPSPIALHKTLSFVAGHGVDHLAMEASSHGLAQYRLDGVRLAAAGFTNLTRDHLDYHGTMESYFAAKARLFSLLPPGGLAVLNADVAEFSALKAHCRMRRVLSYGVNGKELKILRCTPVPGGQALELEIFGTRHALNLPLVGSFMAMNALCAYGLACGTAPTTVPGVLMKLQGAPGRLQSITGHPRGAAVYVDYAHTPDALARTLEALRPHVSGRLVCIFGCGGDRDPGKRPMMGKIATDLADSAIITDDNPRSENPAAIRAAIRTGAGPGAREISDRHMAITQVIAELKAGDVLLIAGKGHEQGQIFADHTAPFDDVAEAERAIKHL